ncbi:MAG: hypothetical protein ACRCUS_01290 [Anaerovoracaceae bacterium]
MVKQVMDLTAMYEKKQDFVKDISKAYVNNYVGEVKQIKYQWIERKDYVSEEIIIEYKNGYKKVINVSGNSNEENAIEIAEAIAYGEV